MNAEGRRHRPTLSRVQGWLTGRRSGALGAVMVIGALAVPLVPTGSTAPAGAATPTPYSVSASPTANLTDGQRVTITIKTDASYPIYAAEAKVCRSGVTYQPNGGSRPNEDFGDSGGNCPTIPLSSSADVSKVDTSVNDAALTSAGNLVGIRVGEGSAAWPVDAPTNTLLCDAATPCTLVVELQGGPSGTWVPWTTPLTYRNDDPIAGCGGPAPGVLTSGGSDRTSDAWVAWTLAECKQPGRTGAAARANFSGEGTALSSYTTGGLDLSYTGAGYDSEVGLLGTTDTTASRPSVAVPLALNATVIAVAGGSVTGGNRVPYDPIKLTLEEAAVMISGGVSGIVPYHDAIVQRNPQLGNLFDLSQGVQLGAYADSEATSYFGTHLFSSLRPEAFRVPQQAVFGSDAGRSRGADANLALADPSYSGALSTLTGRSAMSRVVNAVSGDASAPGGVWFLTDEATARTLGLTTVELQNANGDFVGPTPEAMAAAVPTMKADANGVLIPDPAKAAPVGQPQPYPLTYVEYGLAPTAPLADATNLCRTASQTLLTGWLTYLTGKGQADLPDGFQPLTSELKAQAATTITQVGATPAATPCTTAGATPTTTGLPSDPTPTGPDDGSTFSDTSPNASFTPSSSNSSVSSDGSSAAPAPADSTELAAQATVPDYGGSSVASGVAAMAAIFGIIVLTALAAKATAGRRSGVSGP